MTQSNDTGALIQPTWLEGDTITLAQRLLGKTLAVQEETGDWHPYALIETEAYTANDPACHAYGTTAQTVGTKRSASLYQPAGTAYVYLIYGMYHCLNVITQPKGVVGAVLFRGVISLKTGVAYSGPGKLCKALGITKNTHNHLDFCSPTSPIQLWDSPSTYAAYIKATPRIGIRHATENLWRFIDTRHYKK